MTVISVVEHPVDIGPARKYLFVASTGGHLAELVRLAAAMNASEDSMWVTFESEQSRSLLAGARVQYVPYIASRDFKGVLKATRILRRIMKKERFDCLVSTGAALALSALPHAKLAGIPARYIESVSRVDGPSLTGRIVAFFRMAELRTQHQSWENERWKIYPSVLAGFERVDGSLNSVKADKLSIFVTLGTIHPYRFDALINSVLATGLCNGDTVWQVGATTRDDLPGRTVSQVTTEEFERISRNADVVITHSGVGTILNLLECGIHPVVVPRRKHRDEHVDDHQLQIAALVGELGVATVREAESLAAADLEQASMSRTVLTGGSAVI